MRPLDRLHTTPLDAGLAGGLVLAGLAQAAAVPFAAPGVAALYVVGTTLPLAWRRTWPVEAALLSSVFWLLPLDGFPVLGFVAVLLQFFALGSRGEPVLAVAGVTAFACGATVVGTFLGPEAPVAVIGGVLAVLAPVLAGRLVRHLHRQNEALTALAGELREERARVEEAAIGAERARVAQELHDVLGHELTLIAIHAEAAGAALREQPERAGEPVEAIRATAHRALAEMRQVVDALGVDGAAGAGAAEDVESLAARARSAGIDCTLTVTGTPESAPSPTAMAVQRIVRECLTNAGRHAPGHPVEVRVEWGEAAVVVHSANRATPTGGTAAPGRGLTGIRHRAELLGGTFSAGMADGSFVLRVALPRTVRP
ncbi:hypothetical protein E8D34_08490 [Nocardioides sp. GY 10113]|uniref:sensor histidine kinase n=1 Tax=Nocardioides sp. GY 10113 TaxID=2569761 RepID=UPI0010A7B010|nr:histidine kinase [Nocardioides sp. GY 10113]TIC87704.1 hypothetical protein E8D34_08490 [Nocardioides sp. GY 10113]